jgi:hypothetical protein
LPAPGKLTFPVPTEIAHGFVMMTEPAVVGAPSM